MLKGLNVLAFTHYLQGPLAAQILGDFGAEVIKVESLTGAFERSWSGVNAFLNGVSVYSFAANRSQKSLNIDLKRPESEEIMNRLIERADVLIENFRPGVMERLHLGYETVKKKNPGIIYCSCSAYGSGGPYRDIPGQDLLAQALSGIMMQSGKREDPPMPIGTAVVDKHGAVLAAIGILGALYEKKRTGKGKKLSAAFWMRLWICKQSQWIFS